MILIAVGLIILLIKAVYSVVVIIISTVVVKEMYPLLFCLFSLSYGMVFSGLSLQVSLIHSLRVSDLSSLDQHLFIIYETVSHKMYVLPFSTLGRNVFFILVCIVMHKFLITVNFN
jgi:hypothetical protein